MRTVAFWLSLVLIFVIPWEESMTLSSMGTISRITGFLVAAFWLLTVVVTGRFRKPRPVHYVILLFFLLNAVSFFWTIDPESSAAAVETYLQMAIFILIFWDLYTTPEAVRVGLQAYVLGAYVAIGSLTVNFLSGSQATYGRYSAQGWNPNTIALVLALGVPVAFYLGASEVKSKKAQVLRLVNYAYIPAAAFAISLTASRSAMLATLPALVFGAATFVRLKFFPRVLILIILIGALYALPSLIPQSSIERLATTADEISSGDLSGRVPIWRQGLEVFAEHPLIGIGRFAYPAAIESGRAAHNTFLGILVELGVIGLLLFGIVLVMVFYHAIRQPKWDSRFWLTTLLVWTIGNLTLSWAHKKPTWLFLSLLVVAASVSAQRVESRRGSQAPVKSPGLFKGNRDEASEAKPVASGAGSRSIDSGGKLPFRRDTSPDSQHISYR